MILLQNGSTLLRMDDPRLAEPYYQGTRFDRTGIITELQAQGHRYISPWLRQCDPWRHDNVSGPAEEFSPAGPPAGKDGKSRLKIGVGLLEDDGLPYDRFRLYRIVETPATEVEIAREQVLFRQTLPGYYAYEKAVSLPEDGRLRLEHRLQNTGEQSLDIYVYCHNFFVLDGAGTGPATRLDFPFKPEGTWRSDYDCVGLTAGGIRFSRELAEGESVFMGDLHAANPSEAGYRFELSNADNGLRVLGTCDHPMDHAVFWSNPDVACFEPYLHLILQAGAGTGWILDYLFG